MVHRGRQRRDELLPIRSILPGLPGLFPSHPKRVRLDTRSDVRGLLPAPAGVRHSGSCHRVPGGPVGAACHNSAGRDHWRRGNGRDGLYQLGVVVLRGVHGGIPGSERRIPRSLLVGGCGQLVQSIARARSWYSDAWASGGRPLRRVGGGTGGVVGMARVDAAVGRRRMDCGNTTEPAGSLLPREVRLPPGRRYARRRQRR